MGKRRLITDKSYLKEEQGMLKIHQAVGSFIYRLRRDKRGVTALEYGLIAALIAVVIISAVTTMGQKLQHTFQHVANSLPSN